MSRLFWLLGLFGGCLVVILDLQRIQKDTKPNREPPKDSATRSKVEAGVHRHRTIPTMAHRLQTISGSGRGTMRMAVSRLFWQLGLFWGCLGVIWWLCWGCLGLLGMLFGL